MSILRRRRPVGPAETNDVLDQVDALLAKHEARLATLETGGGATAAGALVAASPARAGSGGGGGSVKSVGLSLPGEFAVSGSPVTSIGILTAAWQTQAAGMVLAGPASGGAAVPTFRALVVGDFSGGALPAHASTHQHGGLDALAGQSIDGLQTTARPTFYGVTSNQGSLNDPAHPAFLATSSGAGWGSSIELANTAAGGRTYGMYSGSDGNWHFSDVSGSVDRLLVTSAGDTRVYGKLFPGNQTTRYFGDDGTGLVLNLGSRYVRMTTDGTTVTWTVL